MKLTIALLSAYLASALELGLELEGFANRSHNIEDLSPETREMSLRFRSFARTQDGMKADVKSKIDYYIDNEGNHCYVSLSPRRSDRSERYFHGVEGRGYGNS